MRSKSLSFDDSSTHLVLSGDRKRSVPDKSTDDTSGTKAGNTQCTVVSNYHVSIASSMYIVTVTWSKNLINHSLIISIEKAPGPDDHGADINMYPVVTCKIELKPWPFWSKKGFKSLDICGRHVDVFWDLRSAKFSHGPEPLGGYYVAMVCYDEVVLVLGDCKKEAYKRTKSRPSLVDAVLVYKRDNVFGKKCFSSRARFDERRREHDIVVENSIAGSNEPEMWISIDGIVLIHVGNLQWNFRGNQTVSIDKMPVQVFWDVHDWLFGTSGAGHALFIFKPGMLPEQHDTSEEDGQGNEGSFRSASSSVATITAAAMPNLPEFCFFLYAWKVE